MLAYTYPLLSIFWTMLMFAGVFLMIFFIIWCLSTTSDDTIITASRRPAGPS